MKDGYNYLPQYKIIKKEFMILTFYKVGYQQQMLNQITLKYKVHFSLSSQQIKWS
jgi:hypothetical protein